MYFDLSESVSVIPKKASRNNYSAVISSYISVRVSLITFFLAVGLLKLQLLHVAQQSVRARILFVESLALESVSVKAQYNRVWLKSS